MAKQTFESAMKELEDLVEDLEGGELSLDLAFKKFEEGIKLSRFCSAKLDETEKKVTILLKDESGNIKDVPFSIAENNDASE